MVVGGGVHGCGGRACMVAGGVCALGGMRGCRGACMVAGAGVRGCRGMHGCGGMCVVVGGMCGWGVCMVVKIQSVSGRYASCLNAFLLILYFLPNTMSCR